MKTACEIILYPSFKTLTPHSVSPKPSSKAFQFFMAWLYSAFPVIPPKTWSFCHSYHWPLPRHWVNFHSSHNFQFLAISIKVFLIITELLLILQKSVANLKSSLISPTKMASFVSTWKQLKDLILNLGQRSHPNLSSKAPCSLAYPHFKQCTSLSLDSTLTELSFID